MCTREPPALQVRARQPPLSTLYTLLPNPSARSILSGCRQPDDCCRQRDSACVAKQKAAVSDSGYNNEMKLRRSLSGFRFLVLHGLWVVTVVAVRCCPLRKVLQPRLIILLKKRVLLRNPIRDRRHLRKSRAPQPKNQPKSQFSHIGAR